MKYFDGLSRYRRLVTMYDILDAIPVPHDCVRLGDLAIDSSDARLERVSLQNGHNNTTATLLRQSTYPTRKREKNE